MTKEELMKARSEVRKEMADFETEYHKRLREEKKAFELAMVELKRGHGEKVAEIEAEMRVRRCELRDRMDVLSNVETCDEEEGESNAERIARQMGS